MKLILFLLTISVFTTSCKVQLFEIGTYVAYYEKEQHNKNGIPCHGYNFIYSDSTGVYFWPEWKTDSLNFGLEKFTFKISNDSLFLYNHKSVYIDSQNELVHELPYEQIFVIKRIGRKKFELHSTLENEPYDEPYKMKYIGKLR